MRRPSPSRAPVAPGRVVRLDCVGTEWGLTAEPGAHSAPGNFPYHRLRPHGDDDSWARVISRPGSPCRCTGDESPLVRVERRLWRTADGRRWLQDVAVTGAPHARVGTGLGWQGAVIADLGVPEDISDQLVEP